MVHIYSTCDDVVSLPCPGHEVHSYCAEQTSPSPLHEHNTVVVRNVAETATVINENLHITCIAL